MTDRLNTLATLARKMMLTPAQAVALPETIAVAARKMSMAESAIVRACYDNPAVCEYLASICRKVV